MKKLFALFLIQSLLFPILPSQTILITGRMLDGDTDEAVIAAHIIRPDGTGTYSGKEGRFQITVARLPVKLRISHITYGEKEIEVKDNTEEVILFLRPAVSAIGEVQVTGTRLRSLTEKDDFTLQDFAFDEHHLWMIGYLNNVATRGRLWLANWFGDTVSSIPVRNPERLFHDVFGNVHLVFSDSVFQVYADADSIILAYTLSRSDFDALMSPIRCGFAHNLVYQTFLPGEEGLHSYYYGEDEPNPKFLACIRDTVEELKQEYDHIYGRAGAALEAYANTENVQSRIGMLFAMGAAKQSRDAVINHQIQTPAFALNDTLYLVHWYKDSLMSYDTTGSYIGSQVYVLERKESRWTLCNLDRLNGSLEPPIRLPDFPGMTGIKVFADAVYFLYPEKKYPFYTRLYRLQL